MKLNITPIELRELMEVFGIKAYSFGILREVNNRLRREVGEKEREIETLKASSASGGK